MPEVSRRDRLRDVLFAAHDTSARRGNVSANVLMQVAAAGGTYPNAVAAALLTLGGVHGPLERTYALLASHDPEGAAMDTLIAGEKVPGWGNSFVKGCEDPIWRPVRESLLMDWPALIQTIDTITDLLHRRGKVVFPNPSAYTAAAAIALEIPQPACPSLFLAARLTAWTDMYLAARPEAAKEAV